MSNERYNADLYAVKVLNNKNTGSYSDIAAGIEWCINNQMDVINLSLGGESDSSTLRSVIQAADAAGIVTVVAAGNDATSGNNLQYPAVYPEVIAVAATDINDNIASFSSYGHWVDIAAPGVNVLSTLPGDVLDYYNGTSMATPHVAGVAALIIEQNPGISHIEVRNRLLNSAIDMGAEGWDQYFGEGLLNVQGALFPPAPLTHDVGIKLTAPESLSINDNYMLSIELSNNGLMNEQIDYTVDGVLKSISLMAGETITIVEFRNAPATPGEIQINASASIEADEDLSNNTSSATISVVDPNAAPIMYVSEIAYQATRKDVNVKISVSDDNQQLLANAEVTVSIYLDGTLYQTSSATSSDTGEASIKLRNAPSGSYSTVIDSVVLDGFEYDFDLNAIDPGFIK